MIHLLLAVIYLSFISLGLPDSLLGSAWPTIYMELQVPVSYAGIISAIIAIGTVISSLQSDRLTRRLGAGAVTAISVAMTAVALFGFSVSHSFWLLCLWAIPYGLGAGSVDASLNNYVAVHYASRHMSWLHCMWGVGASLGPYIMSFALTNGQGWNRGYGYIALLQLVLTAILVFSLPLWKRGRKNTESEQNIKIPGKPLSLVEITNLPGAKAVMATFFCYCALEQTTGLWASSYLTLHRGFSPQDAAAFASLFFIGITIGRGVSGFVTLKLNNIQMVRLGFGIICMGLGIMYIPLEVYAPMAGLLLIGLGCAPIYPCLIHSTPEFFGEDKSQAVIGVQMASAYVGTCLMPPLFGLIANYIHVSWFPFYLAVLLIMMLLFHCKLIRTCRRP